MHPYVFAAAIFASQARFVQSSLVFVFLPQSIGETNTFSIASYELEITESLCTLLHSSSMNITVFPTIFSTVNF